MLLEPYVGNRTNKHLEFNIVGGVLNRPLGTTIATTFHHKLFHGVSGNRRSEGNDMRYSKGTRSGGYRSEMTLNYWVVVGEVPISEWSGWQFDTCYDVFSLLDITMS